MCDSSALGYVPEAVVRRECVGRGVLVGVLWVVFNGIAAVDYFCETL